MSRKKRFAALALPVVVVLVSILLVNPATRSKLEERSLLLRMKLAGELSATPWVEIVYALMPARLLSKASAAERGVVRRVERVADTCPSLWDTPIGRFWGRDEDKMVLQQLVTEALHENIYNLEESFVRKGDVVMDVGAHLGTFTSISLQRGAGRVLAIEPEPVNVSCLRKTFASEIAAGRVVLIPAAAWESEGSLTFHIRNNSLLGSVVSDKGIPVEVPATTLDRVVETHKLERVDFIKMDIEGAERHALRGASQTISGFKPRLALCVYHLPDDPVVIPQIVLAARADYSRRERGTGAHNVMFFF